MTGSSHAFVDPTDTQAVEQVLRPALALLGIEGVLQALAAVVPIVFGKPGGLLRRGQPHQLTAGERTLRIDGHHRATVQHVVGGIVLSTDDVLPKDLPGVLANLVSRSVADHDSADAAAIVLTSVRDAVTAGS